MRPGAYLINISRAPMLNRHRSSKRCAGHLGGAGCRRLVGRAGRPADQLLRCQFSHTPIAADTQNRVALAETTARTARIARGAPRDVGASLVDAGK